MDISPDAALRAVEVSAVVLTVFNAIAGGIVLLLVLLDNHRQRKSWLKLSWERRTPFYLAISVVISHAIFIMREALEMGSVASLATGRMLEVVPPECTVENEISWWGISNKQLIDLTVAIWFPIVVMAMRACLEAGAILLKVCLDIYPLIASTTRSQIRVNVSIFFLSQLYLSCFGLLHIF